MLILAKRMTRANQGKLIWEVEFMNQKEKMILIPPSPMGGDREASIITDPQGSYTGRPIERNEVPVQDADDL